MRNGRYLVGMGMGDGTYPMYRFPSSARARIFMINAVVQSAAIDMGQERGPDEDHRRGSIGTRLGPGAFVSWGIQHCPRQRFTGFPRRLPASVSAVYEASLPRAPTVGPGEERFLAPHCEARSKNRFVCGGPYLT